MTLETFTVCETASRCEDYETSNWRLFERMQRYLLCMLSHLFFSCNRELQFFILFFPASCWLFSDMSMTSRYRKTRYRETQTCLAELLVEASNPDSSVALREELAQVFCGELHRLRSDHFNEHVVQFLCSSMW